MNVNDGGFSGVTSGVFSRWGIVGEGKTTGEGDLKKLNAVFNGSGAGTGSGLIGSVKKI